MARCWMIISNLFMQLIYPQFILDSQSVFLHKTTLLLLLRFCVYSSTKHNTTPYTIIITVSCRRSRLRIRSSPELQKQSQQNNHQYYYHGDINTQQQQQRKYYNTIYNTPPNMYPLNHHIHHIHIHSLDHHRKP